MTNVDTDFIVALNSAQAAGNAHCGQLINVQCKTALLYTTSFLNQIPFYLVQGKSVTATVADTCPGCGPNGIDLSPAAFQALASLDVGRIQVTWNFI